MITKDNLLFMLSGIGAGAIVAVLLFAVLVAPPAGTGTAGQTSIPAGQQIVTVEKDELHQFASQEDARDFLTSHLDEGAGPRLTSEDSGQVLSRQNSLPNGTRTWRLDVDTSTFKPDEYLVTASAVMEEASASALFNIYDPSSKIPLTRNPSPVSPEIFGKRGYFITINPVDDHVVGDTFAITGFTNIPAEGQILIQVVSSSFKPTQKSQSGEFSGIGKTITPSGQTVSSRPAALPAATDLDYSTTNVQVKGVDEADIIKTDGTHIYVVSGNSLHILNAYPADNAGIIATLRVSGSPESLYVNGDRLVLISSVEKADDYWACSPGQCRDAAIPERKTEIFVFSVKNPANPVLTRQLELDGSYRDSRMIGSVLYFVTSASVIPYGDEMDFLKIRDSAAGTITAPVYYFDRKDRQFSLTMVGAVDTAADTPAKAKTFLIGSAGTVYVSPSHLYIAIPSPIDYSARTRSDSTEIYAFTLDGDRIAYASQGRVDGTLLNQYAMDEYNGNLRVATTVQENGIHRSSTSSKVTVFDNRLKPLGSIGTIAPGEKIYAARFMGERLYLVTFRETDPLFVIDLSRPEHPAILGELQIPGFSNYLHPYDATHLIGIGKESTRGGLKMALFDVADVHNPRLVDEEKLGGPGSDSEVLRDPKAFLFDREKNLLVLPVHILESQADFGYTNDKRQSMPELFEWGGAYVFGVDPKTGFSLQGQVIHYRGHAGNDADVKRSLYIEKTLYTMSPGKIVMSDLKNATHLIGEVELRNQ